MKKLLLLIIWLVFLSSFATCIGVSPGRITLDIEPEKEKVVYFEVINNENKVLDAEISVSDQFKDYIILNSSIVHFEANEERKKVSYKVVVPKDYEPGRKEADLTVKELPNIQGGDVQISATIAVMHQAVMDIPFPGKYVSLDLEVVEYGGEFKFAVYANNQGKEEIENLDLNFEAFDYEGKSVFSSSAQGSKILPSRRQRFEMGTAKLEEGKYDLIVTASYAGKKAEKREPLIVGIPKLEITNLNVKNLKLNKVAEFGVEVENAWRGTLNNVYVETIVNSEQVFQSAAEELKAGEKEDLEAYWDLRGAKEGKYDVVLVIHFEDQQKDKRLTVEIGSEGIKIVDAITGFVIFEGKDSGNTLIYSLVFSLIIANIILFVYLKRKRTKN